ncbi:MULTISPECIES: hypothetical protein [Flavobacterium]|uniref:Uncharacterized protein n=1 Tax=Flavobacterium jumunjinense TaxID=998845 RepID=A0ABV5GKA6_9FLAO|nr:MULTISPECIES: hypothetical protein [Flavobacterium]
MKKYIILFLLFSTSLNAQTIFTEPDSEPNCKIMLNGKFLSLLYDQNDYYMIIEDGIQTEYISNGKYYVKCKIEFITDCEYKSTVIEVTIPDYPVKVGEILTSKIIETERKAVKVKCKMGNIEETEFTLIKID